MAAPEEQLPQHMEEMLSFGSASQTAMQVDDEDDDDYEEEEEDEYGKTINDIVTKVMNMNREVKPLPNLLDRKLRQSLPPINGSSASGLLWHSSTSSQTHKYPTDGIAASKFCTGPGKMVRSVSTPEINRFVQKNTNSCAPKPAASRKVTFGDCQRDPSSINSNSSTSTITAVSSEDLHGVEAFPLDNCPAVGFTYKKIENAEQKQHDHHVTATRYSDNKENVCPNSLSNKYSLSQGNLSKASTDWQARVEPGHKTGPSSSVFSREPLASNQVYRSGENTRVPHIATSGFHNIKHGPTFTTTGFITSTLSSVTFTTTNSTGTFTSASSFVQGTPATACRSANTKMHVFSTPQSSSLLPGTLPHLTVKSSSRTPYHPYGGTSLGSRTSGGSLLQESRAISEYSLPFQSELNSTHIPSSHDRPPPVFRVDPYSILSSSTNKARGGSSVLQSTSVHALITTTTTTTAATSNSSGENSRVVTVSKYPTVINSTQLSTVSNSTPAQRQLASRRELFIPTASNNYSHALLSSGQHSDVVANTFVSVSDAALAHTKLPTDLSVASSTITESKTSCVGSYILKSNLGIREEMKNYISAGDLTHKERHVPLDEGKNMSSVNRNLDIINEDRPSTVFCDNSRNTAPLKSANSGTDEMREPSLGNDVSDGCNSGTNSSASNETLNNSGGNTNTGAIHTADPFLLSALRKLDASFDAGHSATLTSYLARNNLPTTTSTTSTAVHNIASSSSFAPTHQDHRHQQMFNNKIVPDVHYQSATPTPTSKTWHNSDEPRRDTYTSTSSASSSVKTTSTVSTLLSKPVAAQSLQAAPDSAQSCDTQLRTTSSHHQCPRDHRTQSMQAGPTSGSDCVTSAAVASQSTAPTLPDMVPLYVNGKQYLKLSLLGRGGSSEVFEVLSTSTRQVVAVKVVQLTCADEQTVQGYRNEISLLQRLQQSDRVIKLHDFEETPTDLRLVMERGNSDLARVLKNARGASKSNPGKAAAGISPFTVQHYWQGMLLAVQAIHRQGIVHSDLKPANFLLVNEMLKLIDFGIATSIQQDMTSVFKDSQAGTFNYMSPESLNDIHSGPIVNGKAGDKTVIKIGMKSDVWSLGCILYNLVYSKTPFQHITNTLQKLMAISNPKTRIEFPFCSNPHLLDTMKLCLQFYPHDRPTIEQLLQHPYLTGVGCEKSISATNKDNIS